MGLVYDMNVLNKDTRVVSCAVSARGLLPVGQMSAAWARHDVLITNVAHYDVVIKGVVSRSGVTAFIPR